WTKGQKPEERADYPVVVRWPPATATETAMTKPVISKDQFIDICNERLREHDMYEEGMLFMVSPEGSTEPSGYTWPTRGQAGDKPALFTNIATSVREDYEVT
ncbi:hypothetical protein, partial [Sulfuriflexus sp.]|uniref:hypothetical protein n=1 Tax=Sulfuriflexus sp. TaxID=2015443 RepID=UPI0028CCB6BD